MPTIAEAVTQNQRRIAQGGESVGMQERTPSILPDAPSQVPALPSRGPFPPEFSLNTDFTEYSRVFQKNTVRSRAFPVSNPPVPVKSTTIVQQATAAVSSLKLQTNNVDNPNQSLLNLQQGANVTIVTTGGGTVIAATGTGDGLIHSSTPWEIDPAFVALRDDFTDPFYALTTVFGTLYSDLNWTYWQPWTSSPTNFAGQPTQPGYNHLPNLGGLTFFNDGTSNHNAGIVHGLGGITSTSTQNTGYGWPIFDYPAWQAVWDFTIGRWYQWGDTSDTFTNPSAFSWSQVSFYLGFGNSPNIWVMQTANNCPRPAYGVFLRYDTDPTAPAISDTQFVFEAVSNTTGSVSRGTLNPQGTTVATGITVTEGMKCRLEMLCTSAGSVTMTLYANNTSFTATLAIPKVSATGTGSFYGSNGIGVAKFPGAFSVAVGSGTRLTVSGGGVPSGYSGTFEVLGAYGSGINFLNSNSQSRVTGACTMSCYPALLPFMAFGNDTTASPTQLSKAVTLDFFGFVWNPGVGGGTGTPNSLLPRYW